MDLLFTIIFIILIITAIVEHSDDLTCGWSILISGALFLWLSSVMFAYDWNTTTVIESTQRQNNIDYVLYYHENANNIRAINLTSKLGRVVETGTKVEITQYKPGWYGGIYYIMTPEPTIKLLNDI